MAAATRFRVSSLSFPLRNFLPSSLKTFSVAAPEATSDDVPDRKAIKEAKRARREKGMAFQAEYKSRVGQVVSKFREQRIEQLRLREAAEGEQQKLLEKDRIAVKMIIEGVEADNAKLAELRKERLEIETWTKSFQQMQKKARNAERAEELRRIRVEIVKKAIEESKEFITPENLEEKIAFALENETNYNFALTPDGKKIHSTEPPGNTSTEMPGPAAFVFSPSSKDWHTTANKLLQGEPNKTEDSKDS